MGTRAARSHSTMFQFFYLLLDLESTAWAIKVFIFVLSQSYSYIIKKRVNEFALCINYQRATRHLYSVPLYPRQELILELIITSRFRLRVSAPSSNFHIHLITCDSVICIHIRKQKSHQLELLTKRVQYLTIDQNRTSQK